MSRRFSVQRPALSTGTLDGAALISNSFLVRCPRSRPQAPGRCSDHPRLPMVPFTGDRGFESVSLQRRVSCELRSSRSAQAASVAIDESVRRDPQPDVGDPRARTAAVSRCHRCTICCDSGRPADQCVNDTDVAGSRGDLGMRRSCPTKQSRRHRSAGTPRVSPSFFFRVPEKTAGHQRVAFPIDS